MLLVGSSLLFAQTDRVRVWQDTVTFPTYKEGPPAALPPFDQFALAGTGVKAIYPYTLRLNMTAERADAAWRVLHLENQYLHCLVLPDLGGHLYTCRDKLAGVDIFYANTSIKKWDVAPRGAWIAGGIETSFPVAHSRVTVSPVHFATVTGEDGSASVIVGTVDRVSGMEWRVAYSLKPGSSVLQQKSRIYNPGPVRQPYQWWTNAAIRLPDTGVQFTYPMWVTAPHGAGVLEPWPVDSGGVDRSRSNNYAGDLGVFAYGSREPFFAEYNPQSRTGVAHWAGPGEVPGKKIWVWGKNEKLYRESLSDDHSGYVEIQAGLATTQDMMEYLEPQQSRTFTELWIPSRSTGGITRATPDAVFFLKRSAPVNGMVKASVDLNVTTSLPRATLTLTKGGATALKWTADLNPATPFHAETEPVAAAGKFHFELKNADGKVLLAHQEDAYDAVTPDEVKIGTPLAASANKDPFVRAADDEQARFLDRALVEYKAALKESPHDATVRKAAGRFSLSLHRFAEATAILEPPGADAEAAYYLGVARSALGDDEAAMALWKKIVAEPRIGEAAQDRLACALARAGQQKDALAILHALAAQGASRAAGLEVALLRRMGQTDEAKAALKKARAADPMDSLLRVEAGQLGREDTSLWAHLAADPEWVLDVADQYMDAGLYADALALLERTYPLVTDLEKEPGAVLPQHYPLIAYYRGYARQQLGQSPADDFLFASGLSTLLVYPHRASSFAVLRAAIAQNPKDATAHYLLGCLLFDARETEQALAEWKLARPAAEGIPAFTETVQRAQRSAQNSATPGADSGESRLKIPSTSTALPPASFKTPAEAADYALTLLAQRNPDGAAAIFQVKNFPQPRQLLEVRQAYAELWLQRLLLASHPGACADIESRIDDFAPEDKQLPFTLGGFKDIAKELRIQYYFGAAEALCGDTKAAERRWRSIAKAKPAAGSIDFAFPVLASSLLDPAASQRSVETALESVRAGAGPTDKGLRLYVEGMLLRAAGRDEAAAARFQQGAAEPGAYARYLNAAAQSDPVIPH